MSSQPSCAPSNNGTAVVSNRLLPSAIASQHFKRYRWCHSILNDMNASRFVLSNGSSFQSRSSLLPVCQLKELRQEARLEKSLDSSVKRPVPGSFCKSIRKCWYQAPLRHKLSYYILFLLHYLLPRIAMKMPKNILHPIAIQYIQFALKSIH